MLLDYVVCLKTQRSGVTVVDRRAQDPGIAKIRGLAPSSRSGCAWRKVLLQLDAAVFDHFFPACDFLLLEFGELFRRVGDDLKAQAIERLGHAGVTQ